MIEVDGKQTNLRELSDAELAVCYNQAEVASNASLMGSGRDSLSQLVIFSEETTRRWTRNHDRRLAATRANIDDLLLVQVYRSFSGLVRNTAGTVSRVAQAGMKSVRRLAI